MEESFEKYSINVLKNIDRINMEKIIKLLKNNNCCFIEDIIEDYLDLFTIDYKVFKEEFNKLNKEFNGNFVKCVGYDMNLLEHFFEI